jgi:hypothetical protein
MSGAYQRLDLERLARVIGMGGSGHDGEALAALRQADRLIRAAGMTWRDVLLSVRLVEGLSDEVQRLRDELSALRTAKATETQQLRDALAAFRRRRRPTRQRGLLSVVLLCCISVTAAMFVFGDLIGDCAGGAAPGANRSSDIVGIAPPDPTASSACVQKLPDVSGLSTNSFWRDCDPALPGGSATAAPPLADPPGGQR